MDWIVEKIEHSGRRGIRGTEIPDHAIAGATCSFDYKTIKQFKPFRITLRGHVDFDSWDMSEILEVGWIKHEDKNLLLVIETANTIYFFKPIEPVEKESLCQNVLQENHV